MSIIELSQSNAEFLEIQYMHFICPSDHSK